MVQCPLLPMDTGYPRESLVRSSSSRKEYALCFKDLFVKVDGRSFQSFNVRGRKLRMKRAVVLSYVPAVWVAGEAREGGAVTQRSARAGARGPRPRRLSPGPGHATPPAAPGPAPRGN
ncbi:hypothetical protein EVAR_44363_1 [Eumeta japonica]|uniref:Uncharacterized protein n=1 Tax=Eumeta variegata TaxID=151549 RepID=A0A4C1X7H4_EUMVA|nr:hypothetical protein EVAR_44363_1 [Eumeta japonica]